MGAKKKSNDKFQKFVERHGGPNGLAKSLGLSRSTVYFWFDRRSVPTFENLKLISDFSNGELSYEDIIEGTSKQ
jgi:DNA-binding phage protein